MKKVFAFALVLVILAGLVVSAQALTVAEFVERFNVENGDGWPVALEPIGLLDDFWWVSTDQRGPIAVQFDPASADDPKDCTVLRIFVRHKPRVSVAVFMNNISAALAAAYPDIPEDERLAEAMRAVRYGDFVLGFSYVWTAPAPYRSAHMGEFVYQEETDYQTLLINVVGE